jgi:membrane protein YqaA with SNARE-associated domain
MSFIDPETINAWVQSPYTQVIYFALSFSESSFFIIPPEVMLIPLGLADPKMSLWYGALATIASVCGAAFGYWIGQKGGKPILRKLFSEKKVETVKTLFQKYDTKAIFVSAFTPIPFKVFTISAGAFDLKFKNFLITSLVGRGVRYMLISALILLFGDSIRYFLEHQFDKFVLISTLGLIVAAALYKLGMPFLEKRFARFTLKQRLTKVFSRFLK